VLAPKTISELNVTLNDWINKLFPLPQNTDWQEILQDTSSPFSSVSSERLANLLDQCVAVTGISEQLPHFLPVLLSCGTPETALTQLLDFTQAFLSVAEEILTGIVRTQQHYCIFSDAVIFWQFV